MNPIEMWRRFWTACFILAACSFVFIAAVVMVRGAKDLAEMLRILRRKGTRLSGCHSYSASTFSVGVFA